MRDLGGRLHLPREILGVSADVFGVVAGIVLLGPFLVGLVAGQLAPALVAALMAVLLVNVYLLNRLRRSQAALDAGRRREASATARFAGYHLILDAVGKEADRSRATLRRIREMIDHVKSGQDLGELLAPPEAESAEDRGPSPWLPDPSDLDTFDISPADFEDLYQDACSRAVAELGDDAITQLDHVVVSAAFLGLRAPRVRVSFDSRSSLSMKRATIEFVGTRDQVNVTVLPRRERSKVSASVKVWQTDPTYLDLIHVSWKRMKPFQGIVTLEAYREPFPKTDSRWVAVYLALQPPMSSGAARLFAISHGKFTELDERSR